MKNKFYLHPDGIILHSSFFTLHLLKVYFHFCTVVLNHLALRVLEVEGLGMVLRDSHYVETAVLQHSVETALASTDSECLAAFAVGDVDSGVLALLVVVVET